MIDNKITLAENMELLPALHLGIDDKTIQEAELEKSDLPLIAIKNTVQFPQVVLPIGMSRQKSVLAIQAAEEVHKFVMVSSQHSDKSEDITQKEINTIGTIAKVVKTIKMTDNTTTAVLQGVVRAKITTFYQQEPYFKVATTLLQEPSISQKQQKDISVLVLSIKELANEIIELSPQLPAEANLLIKNIDNPTFIINFISSYAGEDSNQKQALLETNTYKERAKKLLNLLQKEISFLKLKNKVISKTKKEIDKQQKEYFLQQQLKSIKEELAGEKEGKEIQNLKERGEKKQFSESTKEYFNKCIEKLEKTSTQSPEYGVNLAHIEFMLDLPWRETTKDNLDLRKIKKQFDKDHYGMNKIKERILDYLAVLKLRKDMKSPILCLLGPPGIGKTSLGKSIASALGRKYFRISLGGIHDEAEIRGHRKTYIGAMPGRILKSIAKAKSSNPVIILDEIDKMSNDFRGDPSSAMLEVLDPEQNNSFYDNYLDTEYDLSKVLFIATANSLQKVQPALIDRLEVIELSGYSVEEKIQIGKKYLLPKQLKENGLKKVKVSILDKIYQQIISEYTKESGVRELERQIGTLARSLARAQASKPINSYKIDEEDIQEMLGKKKFFTDIYHKQNFVGVAIGLAWTQFGGEILFIETLLYDGKGDIKLTGNLGDVMKESATNAVSFLKSNAQHMGIDAELFSKKDIHIHVPEGATPKDGPSAGITMLTSLASAFLAKPMKPYIAMTGEITLRGVVLPVGGIKEKVLAAKRAGMKQIILSEQNRMDIESIEKMYLKGLKFFYVKKMNELFPLVL